MKLIKNLINQSNVERLPLPMTILGVVMIGYYLTSVRLNAELNLTFLLAGVSLCSISVTLSSLVVIRKGKPTPLLLLSLLILSYGMLTIYTFRYDVLGAPDVIGEYTIASKMYDLGRWPIDSQFIGTGDRAGRYASCLSVTVLPVFLAHFTGLPLLSVFQFVMPVFGAMVPLLLYLVVRELFQDEKLAFLSAVLMSVGHLQIFMLSYLNREQATNFFLLLSIYVVVKSLKNKAYIPIACLLLVSIPLSAGGHVASDFSLVVLFGFALAPLVLRILRRQMETKLVFVFLFVFLAVCQITWLYFAAGLLFQQHIDILHYVVTKTSEYLPEYISKVLATGEILPSTSAISGGLPTSRLLSYWYYLTVALSGVGLIISLKKHLRETARAGWLIGSGLFMFAFFGIGVLASAFLPELDPARVFAEPFFYFYLSVPFSMLVLDRTKRTYLRYLVVVSLVFIIISLPLNMNLPDHGRILHFHTESSIPPQYRVSYFDICYSDFCSSQWIERNIDLDSWISVDLKGFHIAYLADHIKKNYQSYPAFSAQSSYLVLPDYFARYSLWVTPYPYSIYPSQNVSLNEVLQETNLIYSNGRIMIAQRTLNNGVE